jgi:hypothetical protein
MRITQHFAAVHAALGFARIENRDQFAQPWAALVFWHIQMVPPKVEI